LQISTPLPTVLAESATEFIRPIAVNSLHGGITNLLVEIDCFLALMSTLSMGPHAAIVASSLQTLNCVLGLKKSHEVEEVVLKKGKMWFVRRRCEGKLIVRGKTKTLSSAI